MGHNSLLTSWWVEINVCDHEGITPLMTAAESHSDFQYDSNNSPINWRLILEKPKRSTNDKRDHLTLSDIEPECLELESRKKGQNLFVHWILACNAEIDALDTAKHTALHYAVRSADLSAVKILLETEASLTANDAHRNTPLMLAALDINCERTFMDVIIRDLQSQLKEVVAHAVNMKDRFGNDTLSLALGIDQGIRFAEQIRSLGNITDLDEWTKEQLLLVNTSCPLRFPVRYFIDSLLQIRDDNNVLDRVLFRLANKMLFFTLTCAMEKKLYALFAMLLEHTYDPNCSGITQNALTCAIQKKDSRSGKIRLESGAESLPNFIIQSVNEKLALHNSRWSRFFRLAPPSSLVSPLFQNLYHSHPCDSYWETESYEQIRRLVNNPMYSKLRSKAKRRKRELWARADETRQAAMDQPVAHDYQSNAYVVTDLVVADLCLNDWGLIANYETIVRGFQGGFGGDGFLVSFRSNGGRSGFHGGGGGGGGDSGGGGGGGGGGDNGGGDSGGW